MTPRRPVIPAHLRSGSEEQAVTRDLFARAGGKRQGNQHGFWNPPELQIRDLYASGLSRREIASLYGVTEKMVWSAMRRMAIAARTGAAERQKRGEAHRLWKGDGVKYRGCHSRVRAVHGTPDTCVRCGTSDPSRKYEWANISGDYTNPDDYRPMCASCHRKFDYQRRRAQPGVPLCTVPR